MEDSRKWGLYTYEQDWLCDEFDDVKQLNENVSLARTWLMQMGTAAAKHGLTIQYCMSHCRHILQSVELPAVTQARASADYWQAASNQWRAIGTTAMFAWALGVAPSKDNFWSTQNKEGQALNPSYNKTRKDGEPYNRIQSAVSTLSRGPVTPSDQNGKSDVPLIMRSCMKDGRLLQLARPAFAFDEQFVHTALRKGPLENQARVNQTGSDSDEPTQEVWSGYTEVAGAHNFVVFAAQLTSTVTVTPDMLHHAIHGYDGHHNDSHSNFIVFEANSTMKIVNFSATEPLVISPKSTDGTPDSPWDFSYYSIAPVLANGWTLLGEQDKWVSLSAARFMDVTTLASGLIIKIHGSPGEVVNVAYVPPGATTPSTKSCTVGQDSSCVVKALPPH
jgi:hypothetical protein